MFELREQPIKITGIVVGAENHGDDLTPSLDIKCVALCESEALIELHPELRNILFKKNDDPDLDEMAREAEGIPTALRFPQIKSIKWDYQSSGYTLDVCWGLTNVVIDNCTLKMMKITPQQSGGLVRIEFSLHAAKQLTTDSVAVLTDMVKREIEADLFYVEPEDKQQRIA